MSVEDTDGGQLATLALPVSIENFQRDMWILQDLFGEPSSGAGIEPAAGSLIATRQRQQRVEAALLVGVPPIFQGARFVEVALLVGPRQQGGLAQGLGQSASGAQLVLDEVQGPEAGQRLVLGI